MSALKPDLYAGAFVIVHTTKPDVDYPIYVAILVILLLAALLTVAGGLSAVIWMDLAQTVLMVVGALTLCGVGTE